MDRRTILKGVALGAGAVAAGQWSFALAGEAGAGALIQRVHDVCRRLVPLGWRQLLLKVSGGELDIAGHNLPAELSKPLRAIDRAVAGFGDYDIAGTRGIEPGRPSQSLLYHALAAPTVVDGARGEVLGGFPTLAEIEAVENYVYGVAPPTLDALRARAGDNSLGVVVFALDYRNAPNSVHGLHAELCFSRTGIARLGTIEPHYDAQSRSFVGLDAARPFAFRVVPQRFAAYLAISTTGDLKSFGPQDSVVGDALRPTLTLGGPADPAAPDGDDKLSFWVPVHKLFAGRECIAGLNIALELVRNISNDELAQFHRYLDAHGLQNNWRGDDLANYPFVIRNDAIASLSSRSIYGAGVLEPRPAPLTEAATYKGKPLSFPVDPEWTGDPGDLELSSMQVIGGTAAESPSYMFDSAQDYRRSSPEYLSVRHRVLANGQVENLNRSADLMAIIAAGNYQAQHYIDFTGDGWIEARCPALADTVDSMVPAYCIVGPPDFFPQVSQRDLMAWWAKDVPAPLRTGLWAIAPLALSQARLAANVTLPVGFSIYDNTVTAIVSQPDDGSGPVQTPNGPLRATSSGLPDSSPGLFDPGWDTSQDLLYSDPDTPILKFLAGYGLGSPFVEDAKLCAALGAYWPGISPDATRAYPPKKLQMGLRYGWPTIVPMTDEEIGIVPTADGAYMPWDGVRGPQRRTVDGREVAAYPDIMRTDYVDHLRAMTAALTSRVSLEEYKARIMAMEAVYWALGIHDPELNAKGGSYQEQLIRIIAQKATWAVLAFRPVKRDDAEFAAAQTATSTQLTGSRPYLFEVYRWGEENTDPVDQAIVLVQIVERVVAFVDGPTVLLQRGDGPWTLDRSMPTS